MDPTDPKKKALEMEKWYLTDLGYILQAVFRFSQNFK